VDADMMKQGMMQDQRMEASSSMDRPVPPSGWQGTLTWAGSNALGRKEVQAQVAAMAQSGAIMCVTYLLP